MSEAKKTPKDEQIFRQAALDRLSSPDQLDTMIQITSPRSWLALGVILSIFAGLIIWAIFGNLTRSVDGLGFLLPAAAAAENSIVAPADGQVLRYHVQVGDQVNRDQVLATLLVQGEDGASQNLELSSTASGEVQALAAPPQSAVVAGQPLLILAEAGAQSEGFQAIMYVPFINAQDLERGMEVRISPLSFPAQEYGFLLGEVQFIGQTIAADPYARSAFPDEPVIQVVVHLKAADTPSGYEWTLAEGPDGELRAETPIQATIIVERERPITRVFPMVGFIADAGSRP